MAGGKHRLWICLACSTLAVLGGSTARSDGPRDACRDALLRVQDGDPLEFARVVTRFGDREVVPLLAAEEPGAVRLAAIQAARWLQAPERALPALAALIQGRDSLLAPAAAQAALEIARGLDRDDLQRREAARDELVGALAALREASEKPQLRAELRMMAARTAALLEAAGVPSA